MCMIAVRRPAPDKMGFVNLDLVWLVYSVWVTLPVLDVDSMYVCE